MQQAFSGTRPNRHVVRPRARRVVAAVALLAAGMALPLQAFAQSAVREIARPATPYVPSYSTCRDAPPDDPAAQALFNAYWPSDDRAIRRQLEALVARPVDTLTANEAEAFFLALVRVAHAFERPPAAEVRPLALVAREHGQRVGQRFAGDPFVRCAQIVADVAVTQGMRIREQFTDRDRAAARDAFIEFLERALAGEVPTATRPGVLSSALGQNQLDRGFGRMPDTAAAGGDFETGARHLLDAGASVTDSRHIADWRRYAFMLGKLPDAQRLDIAKRLVAHVEKAWGGKDARTPQALDVYLHVLGVAGDAAFATHQGKDAVAVFTRQLDVAQRLRKRDPADPNHQVSEAIALLLVGDAHKLDGNRRAAWFAYTDAQKVFAGAGANAKDMLEMQDFTKELETRQAALR